MLESSYYNLLVCLSSKLIFANGRTLPWNLFKQSLITAEESADLEVEDQWGALCTYLSTMVGAS